MCQDFIREHERQEINRAGRLTDSEFRMLIALLFSATLSTGSLRDNFTILIMDLLGTYRYYKNEKER